MNSGLYVNYLSTQYISTPFNSTHCNTIQHATFWQNMLFYPLYCYIKILSRDSYSDIFKLLQLKSGSQHYTICLVNVLGEIFVILSVLWTAVISIKYNSVPKWVTHFHGGSQILTSFPFGVNRISISPFILASVFCVFLSVDSSAVIIQCSKLQVSEITFFMLLWIRKESLHFFELCFMTHQVILYAPRTHFKLRWHI